LRNRIGPAQAELRQNQYASAVSKSTVALLERGHRADEPALGVSCPITNSTRGITGVDSELIKKSMSHGATTDNAAICDARARQEGRTSCEPCSVANSDLTLSILAGRAVGIVICCEDATAGRNCHIISNHDSASKI
jgi:hypothetical protein